MKNYQRYILGFGLSALLLSACTSTGDNNGNGQKNTSGAKDPGREARLAFNKRLYSRGQEMNDPYTQIAAINAIMLDDSAGNPGLTDSLAVLYAAMRLDKTASKLADRILAKDPTNVKATEIKMATSGSLDEALNMNRKLYAQTKELKYLFTIASMQAQDPAKIGDIDQTIKEIESHGNLDTETVDFTNPVTRKEEKISARLAVVWLKANIALSKKDIAGATRHLNAALKIDPKFAPAQYYLQQIKQGAAASQQQGQYPGQGEGGY